MDADRDLLFSLLAFQTGAIDADQFSETCADTDPGAPAGGKPPRLQGEADTLAQGGTLTDEQKSELQRDVEDLVARHGGDARAALAATLDERSREVLRRAAPGTLAATEKGTEDGTIGVDAPIARVLISSHPETHEGEGRDPRYTLTHLHAKGGMGQVWRAHDAALNRDIALKELRPESAGDAIVWSRFLYEAKVTARLEHPGVVPVYEMAGGEAPYYTMRFVKGRTLNEAVRAFHKDRAAGRVDDVERVKLLSAFVSVCNAVAYAHSRGIIHRDLKGQNIVLGDYGEVIVLDWGLAKQIGEDTLADPDALPITITPAADSEASTFGAGDQATQALDPEAPARADLADTLAGPPTIPPEAEATIPPGVDPSKGSGSSASGSGSGSGSGLGSSSPSRAKGKESGAGPDGTMQGQLLGTPAYMAPEQARGLHEQVDFRTDVYGLGAILYEMLTGQPPFLGRKTPEILRKVVQDAPAPPRSIVADAPMDLQAVCLKALAKNREDRYQTAADLAKDVQRHLADEPVTAYSEPWTRRASRWARKHRSTVAAAAGLLAATAAASGVGALVVNHWRGVAEDQERIARTTVNDMYGRLGEGWLEDRLDPIQKDFLEKTIAYYEGQTGLTSNDPAVQLEHGEMLRRMGNVYAKFGRREDAEKTYARALALLQPLAVSRREDPEVRRTLASTATRYAEALFRDDRLDEAVPRFAEAEQLMRAAATADFASVDDRRTLARTLRWKGQALRRKGDLAAAGPAYAEARDLLEKAREAAPDSPEVLGELAQAEDFLARQFRETGDKATAEAASRRGYDLLDKLVAQYPTIPRYREGLFNAANELGAFAYDRGGLEEAATFWGRAWREASRLTEDFPDRPEYTVHLAAASTNYGGVLVDLDRIREAEPILKKAVEIDEAALAKTPDDTLVRFHLAKCHGNLGYLNMKRNRAADAVVELEKARDLNAVLVKDLPDVPRYAHLQATYLQRLAEALDGSGKTGGGPALREALALLEGVTAKHPDNVPYTLDLARCLISLGNRKLYTSKPDDAAKDFQAAVDRLLPLIPKQGEPSITVLRQASIALSNVGNALQQAKKDGEAPIRQAIDISQSLARRDPPAPADVQSLSVARATLAETLLDRDPASKEARDLLDQAVEAMHKLTEATPTDALRHFFLGSMAGTRAKTRSKPEDAKPDRVLALAQGRQASELAGGKNPTYRLLLVDSLNELASLEVQLGGYEAARKLAMEIPRRSDPLAPGCIAGARVLVKLAAAARKDDRLAAASRDETEREALSNAVLLLREAIDADPTLDAEVRKDPDFQDVLNRAELKFILGRLAEPVAVRQ
ncbi:serine/threonine-protein kinase [Paludisphaera rhizosphaerae]|uniref:serine/threonine-protein kinase n=1 Tax=Paludisphaera rhizosphaerae TaxID=2711216 RepID=UPI0013EC6CCB|nr:serine/threonine-protein kinase [Paludisphaera rhizosphaerae]